MEELRKSCQGGNLGKSYRKKKNAAVENNVAPEADQPAEKDVTTTAPASHPQVDIEDGTLNNDESDLLKVVISWPPHFYYHFLFSFLFPSPPETSTSAKKKMGFFSYYWTRVERKVKTTFYKLLYPDCYIPLYPDDYEEKIYWDDEENMWVHSTVTKYGKMEIWKKSFVSSVKEGILENHIEKWYNADETLK